MSYRKIIFFAFLLTLAVPVRADFEAPVPVRTVEPEFPPELRRAGISGVVVVCCQIDASGVVGETKVVKASNDGFVPPALAAIKKWRFKPATRDGTAVAVRINIPLKFLIASN